MRAGIPALILIILLSAGRPTPTPPSPTIDPAWPQLADLPSGWTKIEPGGETRWAHDTPYAYWVRPGAINKVFVYFEGGGGCSAGSIGSMIHTSHIIQHYPHTFAQYNSANDGSQRQYYVSDGGAEGDIPAALQTSLLEIQATTDNSNSRYDQTGPVLS